jgi:hypothetical protein
MLVLADAVVSAHIVGYSSFTGSDQPLSGIVPQCCDTPEGAGLSGLLLTHANLEGLWAQDGLVTWTKSPLENLEHLHRGLVNLNLLEKVLGQR